MSAYVVLRDTVEEAKAYAYDYIVTVENFYPLVRELKMIAVLLHLESKKFHVRRIPPKDQVHSRTAVRDEIDGRLRLGHEDRVVDREMHRADDPDTLRHGSDGSRPSKRLHQVAAVVVVASERLPVCRRDEGLETQLSAFCASRTLASQVHLKRSG